MATTSRRHVAAAASARKLAVLIWHICVAAKSTSGYVRACMPERSEILNCALDIRRDAARGAQLAPTISAPPGSENASASSRPRGPMSGWQRAELNAARRCVQAPQRRSVSEGCSAGAFTSYPAFRHAVAFWRPQCSQSVLGSAADTSAAGCWPTPGGARFPGDRRCRLRPGQKRPNISHNKKTG